MKGKRGIIPLIVLIVVLVIAYALFGTDDSTGATIPFTTQQ